MKSLVVFLLLHNAPDSQSVVYESAPMPMEQCDPMQRAVWAADWPAVATPYEVMPAVDAACVPVRPYDDD